MLFAKEIDALQRWVFQDAGIPSMRLSGAPPTVARPVILWENPQRGRSRNVNRYSYVVSVQQYGRLFVDSYDQAGQIAEALLTGIEERYGILPVYADDTAAAEAIAILKNVEITIRNSDTLDIPFTVAYEATYARKKPILPPPATKVHNRFTSSQLREL